MGLKEAFEEFKDELAHEVQGTAPGQTRGDFLLGRKLDRMRREIEGAKESEKQEADARRKEAEQQQANDRDRQIEADYQQEIAAKEARWAAEEAADRLARPGKYQAEANVDDGLRSVAAGRLADAVLFFREAVRNDRSNAKARVELAKCLLAQGSDKSDAQEHLLAALQYANRDDYVSEGISRAAIELLWPAVDSELGSVARARFISLSTRHPEIVTDDWISKAKEMGWDWEDAARRLADDARGHVAKVADRCARLRHLADRLGVPASVVPDAPTDLECIRGWSPSSAHALAIEMEASARNSLKYLQEHVDAYRAKLDSAKSTESPGPLLIGAAITLGVIGVLMHKEGSWSGYFWWFFAALCVLAQTLNFVAGRGSAPYYGRGKLVFAAALSVFAVGGVVTEALWFQGIVLGSIVVFLMRAHFDERRHAAEFAAAKSNLTAAKARWESTVGPAAAELARMNATGNE